MPILKETAIAVPILALMLFVSHTLIGPDEGDRQSTIGLTSWLGGVPVPAERFLAKDSITGRAAGANEANASSEQVSAGDVTPEARIRGVFAQFASGGRRPAT
jgi:hypothetical protein